MLLPRNETRRRVFAAALITVAVLLASCLSAPDGLAQTPASSPAAAREHAEQLRREQRLPEALAAYRALVALEPESFEDRFWVAKLESWTGRLEAAESHSCGCSRSGPTTMTAGSPSPTCGSGAATPRGRATFSRIFAVPTPTIPRCSTGSTPPPPAPPRWEADLEYYGERLRGSAANGASSRWGPPGERLRWRGAVTVQDKFGLTESRFGGEMGLRLVRPFELRGSAYFAPGAEVLPRQGYGLGLSAKFSLASCSTPTTSSSTTPTPTCTRRARARALRRPLADHRPLPVLRHRVRRRRCRRREPLGLGRRSAISTARLGLVRIFAGAGAEPFTGPSREDIGEFSGRTIGAGWRHFLTPLFGFEMCTPTRSDPARLSRARTPTV